MQILKVNVCGGTAAQTLISLCVNKTIGVLFDFAPESKGIK